MFLLETFRGYVLADTGNDPDVIGNAEGTWGAPLAAAATPIMDGTNHRSFSWRCSASVPPTSGCSCTRIYTTATAGGPVLP